MILRNIVAVWLNIFIFASQLIFLSYLIKCWLLYSIVLVIENVFLSQDGVMQTAKDLKGQRNMEIWSKF